MAGPLLLALAALTAAGAAWVRLAPSDPAVWHVAPSAQTWETGGPWNEVVDFGSGAALRLSPDTAAPGELLARLDAVAEHTARTTRLAGSVDEGRITWVTRSALWGFPDYTTAEARADGLYILARQRFGQRDLGVNAARLRDWQARL